LRCGAASLEDGPVTYSVVARDPETGAFGVAVQSHFFSVGAVVPWAEAGVGAVATQAFSELSYGPLGLERMRFGESSGAALHALVAADPGAATRQVAMVGRSGYAAAHTGAACVAHAGHRTGPGWSVQANMMRNATVPDAMAEAFVGTPGELPERLLAALDAAQAQGGDIRGQQAAAILMTSTAADASVSAGTVLRLHVEDHERPLDELRRLVRVHRAYELLGRGLDHAQAGNLSDVVPMLEQALELAPDSSEIRFWLGGLLTLVHNPSGRQMLDALFETNPGWRELIPRLVTAGVIPNLPGVVELLTGEA
jgi:uncharacterized Ntn-hydrolase superfamily protein